MAQYDDSASEAYTSDARSLVQRSTSDQFFNNSTTIPEHSVPSGDPSHQFTDDAGNFFVRQAVRPRRTRIGAFFGPELLDACVEIGPLNPNGDEYVIVVESDELLDVDSYQGRSRCYFNIKNITALDAQHRSVRIEFDSGHARFLCLEFASRLDSEMYSFVAALAAVLNTQRAPQELQQLEHDVLPNWCDFIPDVVYSKAARLYGQRAMNVWTVFSVVWALYQLHKVLGISIREHIQYILLNYLYFGHFFQAINAYMADILESWDAFIVSIALLLNTFYDTFLRIPHLMLRNFRPLFNAIGSFFGVLTQHFASLFKVFSPLWTVISRNWTVFYNAASASFTPMMTLARNFGTNMAAPLAAFRAARVAAAEASAAGAAATDVAQSIGYYRATVDALWSAISAPLKLVVAAFWATVRFVQLARDKWAEKTQREYGARMSELCPCCRWCAKRREYSSRNIGHGSSSDSIAAPTPGSARPPTALSKFNSGSNDSEHSKGSGGGRRLNFSPAPSESGSGGDITLTNRNPLLQDKAVDPALVNPVIGLRHRKFSDSSVSTPR